jgi:hypothetical protein
MRTSSSSSYAKSFHDEDISIVVVGTAGAAVRRRCARGPLFGGNGGRWEATADRVFADDGWGLAKDASTEGGGSSRAAIVATTRSSSMIFDFSAGGEVRAHIITVGGAVRW